MLLISVISWDIIQHVSFIWLDAIFFQISKVLFRNCWSGLPLCLRFQLKLSRLLSLSLVLMVRQSGPKSVFGWFALILIIFKVQWQKQLIELQQPAKVFIPLELFHIFTVHFTSHKKSFIVNFMWKANSNCHTDMKLKKKKLLWFYLFIYFYPMCGVQTSSQSPFLWVQPISCRSCLLRAKCSNMDLFWLDVSSNLCMKTAVVVC